MGGIVAIIVFAILLILIMQIFNDRSQRALEEKLDKKYDEKIHKLEEKIEVLEGKINK